MIRSLSRHGIVQRSLPQRSQNLLPNGRYYREFHMFSLTALGAGGVLRNRTLFQQSVRLLVTTPPSVPPPKTAATAPPPPTPTSATPRKPKVELRPAPVKPTAARTGQTTKPPLSETDASTSSPATEAKPHTESVIEIVKDDWRHASTHGVFALPPPDAGRVGKLWHQAKEYFKFYWNGLKLINTHRLRAREIRERVKAGGAPLDRWEARFLATHQKDLVKLVPFVLIILVLEEVIPLIVLYAPFMLPSTCVLPSQRERIETKRREKQHAIALEAKNVLLPVVQPSAAQQVFPTGSGLTALCGMLSISTMGPPPLRKRRIRNHLNMIIEDDALLKKEGMGERLTHPELLEALEERGIVTAGLSLKVQKARLRWWLENAGDEKDEGELGRRVKLIARSAVGRF